MHSSYKNQVVWIVGASSGIGAALAHELSKRGAVLALSARRQDELEKLSLNLGAQHRIFPLDVADTVSTLQTVQAIQATFGQIDRVIFLAAAYVPMKTDSFDLAVTKNIIDINLMGAFNLVHAVLSVLKSQNNNAQLALCGSVAGYVGLPGGQPYSATKAAIISLAESLYAECKGVVDIKLISPGFVRTSLTDKNNFSMPMLVTPEFAANKIANGLISKCFEIHFPKTFTLFLKILSLLPYAVLLRITQKIKT